MMFEATECIFLVSVLIILYTYAGYPLLLSILVKIKYLLKRPAQPVGEHILQPVTLIVAAFNEESIIEEKIRNTLSLDYPAHLLHLLFITDGSTDKTSSIVAGYPNITLLHQEERRGKLAAMNRAMQFVKTPFAIFSDANGMLNNDAVKKLMAHYTDAKVGGVAGEKKIMKQAAGTVSAGEGAYWRYESAIKKLDARLHTVVGAAGELFSIRTDLYKPLRENIIIEDFVQSLLLCMEGYVVRYEPAAWSEEKASPALADEIERKVRISAGGFQAMAKLAGILNVFRYPVLFFQYFSHRVLRWTFCPLALITAFFSAFSLFGAGYDSFYIFAAIGQAVFYALAIAGWALAANGRKILLFYFPFYFLMMNFCVFAGFFRFLSGASSRPGKRPQEPEK